MSAGAVGRCVDLEDCRIDYRASGTASSFPGFGAELPDAVLVRGIAGGTFGAGDQRLGVLHALRELGVPVYNDARPSERSVDKHDQPVAARRRKWPRRRPGR